MSRIMITGMGVISAIGTTLKENRDSLINERGGITQLEFYTTAYAGRLPCGEIKISSAALHKSLFTYPDPTITRSGLLVLHAAEEAIKDSGLTQEQLASTDTALVGATTVGGMCLTDELFSDAHEKISGSPYTSSYDCASITLVAQKRFGILGEINTINTACSSSANAILYGARLIRQGFARRAIVGGADSLAKFTINGFNALNILSYGLCAPFDRDRRGLNLGEGAAFLVLEKEEDVNGKKIYAELSGYGNSNDAFHPSSISLEGEGPYLSMKEALERAKLNAGDIGYINAHGTGTENNDETESVSMQRLFGTPPPFASTKSFTGHTLGASGAIEAVYSVMGLAHQELYPSLQFREPIPATGFIPVKHYRKQAFQHIMSNSFGFGGNCSTLIFSKP
ncbi:MAG: beta-ketoacyl-[acyl-carrier-protein] synthase family protein [Bacteroidota bacterium]|nr:beta-ketoacyl-[acyl-carrier-protein] synthase family protein [Bacteroidota bacterium]